MNSSKIEISRVQLKRNMRSTAMVIFIGAIAFSNITKHSNIRAVEVLPILGCGIAIGALIVNLFLFLNLNKQKNSAGTSY